MDKEHYMEKYLNQDIDNPKYLFQGSSKQIKDTDSYQYKCEDRIIPIDVIEVKYSDYEQYYKNDNE